MKISEKYADYILEETKKLLEIDSQGIQKMWLSM